MIVNFCSSLICCIWPFHAFTTSQHFVFVCLALFSSGCTLPHWNCFCQWLQTVLQFGVPQRSIFGPVTFILYTQQLVAVVSHHSFFHHRFSDDSQLHAAAHLSELHKIIFFPPKLAFLMSSLRCITRNCSCTQDEHDSHYSKIYSENPNFAVFHPAEWLWNTFVYFCPEPWCHSWSNSLFSVTCILYLSIYIYGSFSWKLTLI